VRELFSNNLAQEKEPSMYRFLTFVCVSGLVAASFVGVTARTVYAQAGVAAGQQIFAGRCAGCHTADEGGRNKTGPNLFTVFGAPAGNRDVGFRFSSALSGSGVTWDEESLDAWLASPRRFVPGNRMSFGGLSGAGDRANVVAFLKSLNPPPALVAPEAAEIVAFDAVLSQSQTVPQATSVAGANGRATVFLNSDTNEISWLVDFASLSGDLLAIHFHGPAAAGVAADVVLDIGAVSGLERPIMGRATLTDEHRAQSAGRIARGIGALTEPPTKKRAQNLRPF
jgi:cytochrome c